MSFSAALWAAAAASFGTGLLVLATAPLHRKWSADLAGSGVQKQHSGSPSRVGLLPILAGCGAAWATAPSAPDGPGVLFALLLLCALPAALCGLLEDLTKSIRARWRLLAPTLGALMAVVLLDATVPPLGVPVLDGLLAYWPVAVGVTLLMVVGFTQAMNIVDGLNGLSSGLAILMLGATAWAAHSVGDVIVMQSALVLAVAIAGFWVLNFPRGLIFLGDGGAYFLGFSLAVLWIVLLARNPGVSVWFVMAVAAHPTAETIFSIVRRRFLRRRARNATAPDRLHLHSLMFRRRTRVLFSAAQRRRTPWAMNAMASAVLLAFASLPIVMACINPTNPWWNFAVMLLSVAGFLHQFGHMVGFRGNWLFVLGARPKAPEFSRTLSPGFGTQAGND